MVTVCGTVLAVLTASMPQWTAEKWSAVKLRTKKFKPIALTRGNGHQYVMIILSYDGSWDLKAMATGRLQSSPSTEYFLSFLAAIWVLLLLTVTGIKQHTWFLVACGASGSLWQIYLAAKPSAAKDFDIDLKPWQERSTITGYQYLSQTKDKLKKGLWKTNTEADAEHEYQNKIEESDVKDVMGSLMELEKCIPKAGAALLPTFFPGGLDYQPDSLFFEREKKFWRYANVRRM